MAEERTKNIRDRAVSGFFWRFAERCGAQGLSFVVSIVLARVLEPEAYGSIALILVFTSILQVFIDSGMGTALIQKKDADDLDFSSVFYFNVVMCLVLYGLLFVSAPFISSYYRDESLTGPIRVLGLTLVISGARNIQQAFVSRRMQFKRFFYSTLGGILFAAIVGIAMAYSGYGIWALIAQQLLTAFIGTVILFATVKWYPKRVFSLDRLRGLFSYGWKLLVSALLNTVYLNIRQLVIGRMYSPEDLAFYNRGHQFPELAVNNINVSIDSVLLPAMSKVQSDIQHIKNMTRRSIQVSCFVMWPLMIGLLVCAEPLIRLLLTDKWVPAVPYLRIFCLVFAFQPIQTANLNAIKAIGRSDLFLRLEILKKVIGLLILFAVMDYGVFAIAASMLAYSLVAQLLNSWPNRKLIGYSYAEQLRDISPFILLSCVMGVFIWMISFLEWPDLLTLIVQIIAGAVIYVGLSVWLKLESYNYVLNIVMNIRKGEK